MRWLKTWLMKWIGVDAISAENAELILRLDAFGGQFAKIDSRIEGLRESYASVKEMGDACMARLDRETMKLATAINSDRDGARDLFDRVRADLIDIVKAGEEYSRRISEIETLTKDATIDTALAAVEDRVARLESTPVPTPGPQGRRGGSAWNAHQVAASAGASLVNGMPSPIPTPGVS